MYTSSLAWPSMFDLARNRVGVLENGPAIVSRTRLLLLTNPTELFNKPRQGVGLPRYLWQYNSENTRAMIQDRVKDQLREHEPYVYADQTSFADSCLFTGKSGDGVPKFTDEQRMEMTIGLSTVYGDTLEVTIDGQE